MEQATTSLQSADSHTSGLGIGGLTEEIPQVSEEASEILMELE